MTPPADAPKTVPTIVAAALAAGNAEEIVTARGYCIILFAQTSLGEAKTMLRADILRVAAGWGREKPLAVLTVGNAVADLICSPAVPDPQHA